MKENLTTDGWDEIEIEAEPPKPEPPTMAERASLGGVARARRYEKFRPVPSTWDVLWDRDGDDLKARDRAEREARAKAKPK